MIYSQFKADKKGHTYLFCGNRISECPKLKKEDVLVVLGEPNSLEKLKEINAHKIFLVLSGEKRTGKYKLKSIKETFSSGDVPESELTYVKSQTEILLKDKTKAHLLVALNKAMYEKYVKKETEGIFDDIFYGPVFLSSTTVVSVDNTINSLFNEGFKVITPNDPWYNTGGLFEIQ